MRQCSIPICGSRVNSRSLQRMSPAAYDSSGGHRVSRFNAKENSVNCGPKNVSQYVNMIQKRPYARKSESSLPSDTDDFSDAGASDIATAKRDVSQIVYFRKVYALVSLSMVGSLEAVRACFAAFSDASASSHILTAGLSGTESKISLGPARWMMV